MGTRIPFVRDVPRPDWTGASPVCAKYLLLPLVLLSIPGAARPGCLTLLYIFRFSLRPKYPLHSVRGICYNNQNT